MHDATRIYDLRSFIDVLEQHGELVRVAAEVDWRFELGAIATETYSLSPSPALLFENVKGYNIPVFVSGLYTIRRLALALGLDSETGEKEIIETYVSRIDHPIRPTLVESGACKETKIFDEDVDLLRFPVPVWNEKDQGRYIGTWNQVVVKDPETGWINVGTHRMVVHERNICGIRFPASQHIDLIYRKYRKLGRAMPVAVCIGTDPVCMLASSAPFPAGVDEWSMAGALRQTALQLVRCETVDLLVPAHAELVLEGEIPLEEVRAEGPFGEHTGYYGGGVAPVPIMVVKCITHREKPIFRGTAMGRPVTEESRVTSLNLAAQAHALFKASGFPGIKQLVFPASGDPWFACIIGISKSYPSQALDAGRLLLSNRVAKFIKHVIVVDEDIDIFDLGSVLWAVNTRVQASRDIYVTKNESGSRMDPSVSYEYLGYTDKMIVDATWPSGPDFLPRTEWEGECHPPEVKISEGLHRLIMARWPEYGITNGNVHGL